MISNHFSKSTNKKLATKGIRVLGPVALPDFTSAMPMANIETGYAIDDNGTHRIVMASEVLRLANII